MLKKIIIVVVILGLVFFIYKSFDNKSTSSGSIEDFTVRLSWVHQAQFAGFYVAKEKGFYNQVNLNVDFLEADTAIRQTEEISQGGVSASVMEAHQLLGDSTNINNLQAVFAIYQINPHVLATRQDSGITEPKDFNNKTIGLAGGKSEGSALFETFIEDVGGVESVKYIELGFNTVDDFINKRADVIDVYRIDQPYLAAKKGVPLNIISLDAYGFSTYGDVIVMNRDFLQQNPNTARRFIQATLKGWEYALTNPKEAISITLGYTTGDYKDQEYQDHIMFESIPLVRGEVFELGIMDLIPWSTLYESMKRVGVITKDFEIRDIYTNKFIR